MTPVPDAPLVAPRRCPICHEEWPRLTLHACAEAEAVYKPDATSLMALLQEILTDEVAIDLRSPHHPDAYAGIGALLGFLLAEPLADALILHRAELEAALREAE